MSILNSVSESQRSNRKEYKKLLKRLTNCFRHNDVVDRSDDDSDSLLDDDNQEIYVEDSQEMKEYVKGFRLKVDLA